MKRKSTIESLFEKQGIGELYGENVPVMFKRSFIVDGTTTVEAGTLCYIEDTRERYSTTDEDNSTLYRIFLYFPTFSENLKEDVCILQCKANLENKTLTVVEGGQEIPFAELFCSVDKETADAIREYDKTRVEYQSVQCNLQNTKFNSILWGTLVALIFCILAMIFGVISTFNTTVSDIAMNNSAGWLAIITIGILVVVYFGAYGFQKIMLTKKCNGLRKTAKALCEAIASKDAELVKKFTKE